MWLLNFHHYSILLDIWKGSGIEYPCQTLYTIEVDELAELKKENERLKQNNSLKSDIISISAHQLRTSLSALKWIFKMFIDKDIGELTGEQESFLKKALESNERMIILVNDMLTLNHTDETALAFKKKPTDILKLTEETLFEFSGESHKKEINIIFLKPDGEITMVCCDPEMIRVVLQNLVENALKYSEKGQKIFISINQNDKNFEISVRDHGIGILDEDQAHIFEKFFRAENAKKKDPLGSGLGLFTIKKIIDYHKGRLWFESTTKNGTTFFVTLPIE